MTPDRSLSRLFCRLAVTLAVLCGVVGSASAGEFVFETAGARYVLGDDGTSRSLRAKDTGRELLAGGGVPFASVRSGGRTFPVSRLTRAGELYRAEFGGSSVSAEFRIAAAPDRIVFELARLDGAGVDEVRLAQLRVRGLANSGVLLTVSWDEKSAVSLMGLSDKVDSRLAEGMLVASVYREYGMVGEKAALVAVPTHRLLETVRKVEGEFGLPSPKIGGSWAKSSSDARSSYLFTDLTEANADETIRLARLAGFRYIMIYSTTWASSNGSYPINRSSFPRGEESLKAVIDKCHKAGLKVGMHMLTSFVDKNDPLVRGPQVRWLVSDTVETLATDLDAGARDVVARSGMAHFQSGPYGSSHEVRIDDEIIHYQAVGGPGSTVLTQVTRGYGGTKAAPHRAGTKIHHLAEYFGSYMADLRSPLKDELAERVAGVINRCGFDMIFFDGGEGNCVNGPCWYWAGQQQMEIWKRVKRDLLVEGSAVSHWTWHISTRGYSGDFPAVAPKPYLDTHKIADMLKFYGSNFMPVQLGWTGFLASAPDYPATTPDEIELYAVRMLALDVPVSLETSFAALKGNGRTGEIFQLLGEYEQLRLSNAVPGAIRDRLRSGEWHKSKKGSRHEFLPVRYDVQRVGASGEVRVKNGFAAQDFKFRIQAGPELAKVGERANIRLLSPDTPLALKAHGSNLVMPGALVGRIDVSKSTATQAVTGMARAGGARDLSTHRALAVTLKTDGPVPMAGASAAVLNIQLESGGGFYRDYYVDLDVTGEKTVVIPEPTTERLLPEFRPAPANYAFNSAMQGFNYKDITAVNFRWMRLPGTKPIPCTVMLVEALAEKESSLKDPVISVGAKQTSIPILLKTGEYLESWGEGTARVFNRDGVQLSAIAMPDLPQLKAGDNTITLRGSGSATLKLTTILLGNGLQF